MYRIMLSTYFIFGLVLSAPVQAIRIDLLPALQVADVNTRVSFDLTISDLVGGAAPSLGSYDLNIIYDPTMLSFAGSSAVSFGNQLDLFGLGSMRFVDDSTLGLVNLFELSFDPAADLNDFQLPDFTLATLSFDTLLAGTSTLGVAVNALGDANGDILAAEASGAEINARPLTQIPEPMSLLLLATGLAAFCWRLNPRACHKMTAS